VDADEPDEGKPDDICECGHRRDEHDDEEGCFASALCECAEFLPPIDEIIMRFEK